MPKVDISIRELVDKVERAELLLPEMQRRYVWPATRVRDLLDSLYRGYPSGTILVWETDKEVETRELAVAPTRAPIGSQRYLLLDGQQRITSLTAILNGQPVTVRNRRRPIDILFNVEHPEGAPTDITEVDEEDIPEDIEEIEDEETASYDIQEELRKRTFVVSSRALINNPTWVKVTDIFSKSDSEILRAIGVKSEDPKWDKYAERIQQVKKIADYQYVMQVLDNTRSYEEVTEIFVRVNSLGIKLRGSDLALAQITSRWPGFMKKTEELAETFNLEKDFIIESGLPIRLLVVFATHQSRFKTIGRVSNAKLEESWALAIKGLQFAINFLRSHAGIDHLSYLSSPFLIIPIAVYAVLKEERLSAEETNQLLKWFFYAHMRGHYSLGSSETILDQDLAILFKSGKLSDLLQQLQLRVKKFGVDVDDIRYRGIRSPMFSMLYFVMHKVGAKDWFTGLPLSEEHIGHSHAIQYHHIFPKSLLQDASYEKKEVNEIANMAFIGGKTNRHITNRPPKEYFPDVVTKQRGDEALRQQLVPIDEKLWEIGEYPKFLDWRRAEIAWKINEFMEQYK